MKKKLLITLAMACLLCSCGNVEEKATETTTTTSSTTTIATTTTKEATTHDVSMDFADPLPENVVYDDYDEFLSAIKEEHGDLYFIPEFDMDNYDFVDVKYEINKKDFDIHLTDIDGNHVHFKSRAGESSGYYSDLDEYYNTLVENNTLNLDYVKSDDMYGVFHEYFDCKGEYFFVGYSKTSGYDFEFIYSEKNTDSSVEDITQAMKDFGLY